MIIPSKGRVLIKKLKRDDAETEGGVYVPGQAREGENLSFGEIVKHNPSNRSLELGLEEVRPGTKVYFSRYSASNVTDDDGKIYLVVSDLDIMATQA